MSRAGTARLVALLGALIAIGPLSIDMYLPAFPQLQADLGASAGAVQATLAVFLVGMAAGQGLYGPLADRYGRRRPLLIGLAAYVVASAVAALAADAGTLTVARLFQALGGCAGMVIARAIVADLFDERDSARMFSTLMLVMGLAPILAPSLGGLILTVSGWSGIFWVLCGFGALAFVATMAALPETLPPERRSGGGVGSSLRAYTRLLANPRFLAFAAGGGLAAAGMFAYITGSPFVFIDLYGLSPQAYGIVFGLNAFGLIVASQVNARLLRRFRAPQILSAAIVANAGAALVLTLVVIVGAGGLTAFMVPLFVVIASIGFILPNSTASAMARAGGNRGAASALIGVIQYGLGAATGIAVGVLQGGSSALPMALLIAGFSVLSCVVILRRGPD